MRLEKYRDIVGKRMWAAYKGKNALSQVWQGYSVPVIVLAEYENFFLLKVLKHKQHSGAYGESQEYETCINKADLLVGDFVLRS